MNNLRRLASSFVLMLLLLFPLYSLSFSETYFTLLPAGTDGSGGTSARYALFGDWPQSPLPYGVKVDESKSVKVGSFTYYYGSDDCWYAKFDWDYYKVEPIKWRLLTDSYDIDGDNGDSTGLLLLAENILTANVSYYTSTYDNSELTRTLNGTTIYTNNYKYSNIRAYLNGTKNQFVTDGWTATDDDIDWTNRGFLQTAFTASAQDLISTTTVDNSAASTNLASSPTYYNGGINDYACGYTTDKIFLLSYKESTDHNTYGLGGQLSYGEGCPRIRKTTDYAKANHALQSTDNKYGGNWWMRSPYYDKTNTVRYVSSTGNVAGTYNVSIAFAGIVPALCVETLPE